MFDKKVVMVCVWVVLAVPAIADERKLASDTFGVANPNAPTAIKDFALLIGRSDCQSVTRLDADNWGEPVAMSWTFKYIMDGWAVQDDTIKADGKHSGSIRQYDPETGQWLVHFFSSQATPNPLPTWTGGTEGKDLVFWREQPAPNGMEGSYRLTFSDISETGFNWLGAWVSKDESVTYPTWKITCQKQTSKPHAG